MPYFTFTKKTKKKPAFKLLIMEKLIIREAVPNDAEGILNVYYKTWLDTYSNKEIGITRDDIEDSYKDVFTDESVEKQKKRITEFNKRSQRWVAEYGSQIVGVMNIEKKEECNELRTVYVLPEFQGKGIGKMLWQKALKFFDPKKDIVVKVATYNQNTIEFYKKLGFVDTGKRFKDERWKMKSGAIMPEMEMVIKRKISYENFISMQRQCWQKYIC